jgi:hypothetical protein
MKSAILFSFFALTLLFALVASSPIENEELVDRNGEQPLDEEINLKLCKFII